LRARFSTEGQSDKFREELKARRQKTGETLQQLQLDIQHLTSKAYPGVKPSFVDHIARDAFLDAMIDQHVAIKIRELDLGTLDLAYKHAIRLQAVHARTRQNENQASQCADIRDAGTQKSDDTLLLNVVDRLHNLETVLNARNQTCTEPLQAVAQSKSKFVSRNRGRYLSRPPNHSRRFNNSSSVPVTHSPCQSWQQPSQMVPLVDPQYSTAMGANDYRLWKGPQNNNVPMYVSLG
jgi:hypothetical protein